jgi:hypothetical protein
LLLLGRSGPKFDFWRSWRSLGWRSS